MKCARIHPRPAALALVSVTLAATSVEAGNIHGKIELKAGTDPRDVVVYVESVPETAFISKPGRARISQRGARFRPSLLPIVQGSEVDLTNDDWVEHSVYSHSLPKVFDLGLYGTGESKVLRFEKVGEVELGCFIHPKMGAVILVLQNPFFATPSADGTFVIEGVPAANIQLKAYIRGEPPRAAAVQIPKHGSIQVKL